MNISEFLSDNANSDNIEGMSIPQLELLVMLTKVRVLRFITKEAKLEVCKQFIWSDFECAG